MSSYITYVYIYIYTYHISIVGKPMNFPRWAVQWMNKEACFAERLVAFAAVEGILFSGSFCVSWQKRPWEVDLNGTTGGVAPNGQIPICM